MMFQRKIIARNIGKTIYQGQRSGEAYHSFTDYYHCPFAQKTVSIPGRGALVHRIAAFFFTRLQLLGVPTHFLRSVNMRESLVYEAAPLPFETVVRYGAVGDFAKTFGLAQGTLLERPIFEHIHMQHKTPINESHVYALHWLDVDDMDDLQIILSRTVDFVRGMLMGVGLHLMEIRLLFGKTLQHDENFFLMGDISPESLCVLDIGTQEYLGRQCLLTLGHNPVLQYQSMAQRLGLHLGPPQGASEVVPLFSPPREIPHD